MKYKETFINIAIAALIIGTVILIIIKFVINKDKDNSMAFRIDDFDTLYLEDLDGHKIKFSKLLDDNRSTFCLIFEMSNCGSCIFEGIEDLKRIKNTGKQCFAVVVHDLVDEVAGWSIHYKFSPFFAMKKVDFYEHIQSPLLPVVVKIKGRKVENFRYIIP